VAKGQFGRAPRHQKLVGLYGKKFHQLAPKTEFFNTISPFGPMLHKTQTAAFS
jgi:hypothetical protein